MMAVIVVRVSACSWFRHKRAQLFFAGLEYKAQNSRPDHKYR